MLRKPGEKVKLIHFWGSLSKPTFLIMEMYKNCLIIQKIHSLFGLLNLSNHYGAEIEVGLS